MADSSCMLVYSLAHVAVSALKLLRIKGQLQRIIRPQNKKLNPWAAEQGRAVVAREA